MLNQVTKLRELEGITADSLAEISKRIDEIRARCDAATPGPWDDRHSIPNPKIIDPNHMYDDTLAITLGSDDYGCQRYAQSCKDAAFIAHSREDIPYLIEQLKSALAQKTGQAASGPLTLDELRQMVGQPVWLVEHDSDINITEWVLCVKGEGNWYSFTRTDGTTLYGSARTYGKLWFAYRQKPEEAALAAAQDSEN